MVFAGSRGNGVYMTLDHSNNWIVFNSGLADLFVQALAVSNGYVFSGTLASGLWRRALTEITSAGEIADSRCLPAVFPNPAEENVTVEFCPGLAGTSRQKYISMYDPLCRQVMQKTFSGNKYYFDISGFPPGVYMIEIKSEMGVIKKRIMKL
jgi:hypothetical protein